MSERTDDDGSRRRRLAKYAGLAVAGLVVLVVVLFVLGIVGIPDGGIEDNRWGKVEDQEVEVITDVGIDNPNPVGGEADVEYDIELQGVSLARGGGTDITVDSGSNVATLSTILAADKLPAWWSAHLNNDEVSTLAANATVDASVGPLSGSHDTTIEAEIDTDIEGALDDASSTFEGSYPEVEPLFVVEEATTQWGEITESNTEIRTTFELRNPRRTPLVFPKLGFAGEMAFNEITVADWESEDVTVVVGDRELRAVDEFTIGAGETEQRTFVVELDNEAIGEWFPTHVEQEEFTEMRWSSELVVEVSSDGMLDRPSREVRIPPGDNTVDCDFDLQTGIFVDQNTDVEFQGCVAPSIGSGFSLPTGDDDGILDDPRDDDGVLP